MALVPLVDVFLLVVVLAGVVVLDFPPHQLLLGFVVVLLGVVAGVVFVVVFGLAVVAGAVVVVVVAGFVAFTGGFFVVLEIGQVHVGEAVPSLHICWPVDLLHEATPPWPAQHAA